MKTLAERFWPHVDKSAGPDGCWIWLGGKAAHGYGSVWDRYRKTNQMTHRVSWELTNGPIPTGLQVLHKCDNPPCVNPAHLFLGTVRDNVMDMMAKGRSAFGFCSLSVSGPGEQNPHHKLTDADVLAIRQARAEGEMLKTIAKRYGISSTQAGRIVRRECWKHI